MWINVKDSLPPNKELVLVAMPFSRKANDPLSEKSPIDWIIHLGYFRPEMGWDLPYWDGVPDVEWWTRISLPNVNN